MGWTFGLIVYFAIHSRSGGLGKTITPFRPYQEHDIARACASSSVSGMSHGVNLKGAGQIEYQEPSGC